jgi:hypothetical protein
MNPLDRTLIVIPARNEAESIAAVVGEIRAVVGPTPLLVLDDGSTDATGIVARQAGAQVLSFAYHVGLGGCVQAGYQYAFRRGFEYVIRLDGDGQHDPADILPMARKLRESGCELVIASRYLDGHSGHRLTPRTLGTRFFSAILGLLLGQPVTDPTSGFIGVNRRALELFSRTFPLEYPEIEALVVLQRRAFRFTEIPTVMRPRVRGKSSITSVRAFLYMVHVLLGVFVNIVRLPKLNVITRKERK